MDNPSNRRAAMVIRVAVVGLDPLSGTASAGPDREVEFEGWLGLLGVLSELIGPPAEAAAPPVSPGTDGRGHRE